MSGPDQRLLVITLSNIGDLVMTTPVMEALAQRFPNARIDVVADARSSSLLHAAPYIGTIHHRDKRAGLGGLARLVKALRVQRYRLAVDLRTPVIPYLVRAEQRLVKPRRKRARVRRHAVSEHFEVLQSLLGPGMPPLCRLYLDATVVADAQVRLAALPQGPLLAIAPGANWPGKEWPVPRYRALLDVLREDFAAAVILGNDADREKATSLGEVALPVLDLTGRTALPLAAAILARMNMFIGNDSGLGHIAAAMAVPTLTLFGPGEPQRYRPWGPRGKILLAPGGDLQRLEVERVVQAARATRNAAS